MKPIQKCGPAGLTILLSFAFAPQPIYPADVSCGNQLNKKHALIIGNGYAGEISGRADALIVQEHLCQMDFSVLSIYEEDLINMRAALDKFATAIKKAKAESRADVILFFYSGHGFQLKGKNYLLPVGATIDPDRPELMISLDEVLDVLKWAGDGAVKLIFLDACRSSADLPVVGGRRLENVKDWHQGLAKPSAAPLRTLFGYAASYGRPAASGLEGELSPYTEALSRSLREPGLEIRDLLARVHNEVYTRTFAEQVTKEEGIDSLPDRFYLRAPVSIQVQVKKADDGLVILLRDEVALSADGKSVADLTLNARNNEIKLLVSNEKTFHNGHTWERTEGWSYHMSLLPNGTKLDCQQTCIEDGQPVCCLKDDGEVVPFKDGPHHGKVFVVARANLFVDPATADVSLRAIDDEIWNRELPTWAINHDALYTRNVKELPLDDILDPGKFSNFGVIPSETVVMLLRELLKTGKLLGQVVANPEQTFFVVRGNKALKEFTESCFDHNNLNERIEDLRNSVKAVLERHPRPFDSFDQALLACIQRTGSTAGSSLPLGEMRVWTAIEDRSMDPQPGPSGMLPTNSSPTIYGNL